MGVEELYIHVLLLLVILSAFTIRKSAYAMKVIDVPSWGWGFMFAVFAVYCMAELPVPWGTWADRHGYANNFILAQQRGGGSAESFADAGFTQWVYWTAKITDYQGWFYLTAIVYVGNYMIAAWRFTREYSYVLFLMMLCCFQFYGYGTNTIRAGFAGSFLILGLSFCNDWRLMSLFLAISLSCHNSMIIPIAALILAYTIRKTRLFIIGWLFCVVLSFAIGGSIQERFMFLVNDNRSIYLAGANWQHYKVGFRWDFLLYSTLPIILGYYYIYRLNYKNEFYELLYRMYLAANGFWVLVIRANFTDRFAYLSWFLFPILLAYPVLSKQLYRDATDQSRNVILVMTGEFAFTFFMYLLYGGTFLGLRIL